MKTVFATLGLLLAGLSEPASAQLTVRGTDENAATTTTAADPAAAGTSDLTPATADPLPLLPDLDAMPDQTVKEARAAAAAAVDPIKQRIRFREVKTKALKDPAVQEEKEKAEQARTDSEKRVALKNYYKLLYERMAKIDSSLVTEVRARETQAIARFSQRGFTKKKARLGEAVRDDE